MWKHNSDGGWHFVSLPKLISEEIRTHLKWQEEGWGRLKVIAQVEDLQWETAIWFDTKADTYLLPIKANIRKKLSLEIDTIIDVLLLV
ncbi:DUF1905 domain-containing protein [Winogradskyella sp.]|uniref:DUF1905 domain-containing protein n=1 Tax=Winogradskyella sp. TaxID=1883156 RepID=UPI0025F662C3|nr:DUF1905 domain-containing protein [Winogradskyella sp.]